jgi:hypothetical protein
MSYMQRQHLQLGMLPLYFALGLETASDYRDACLGGDVGLWLSSA